MRHDMYGISIDIPYLDEVRLECQYPRIRKCETLWLTFPINSPIWSCPPSISIDKEREFGIVEEELAIETFDMNRSNILFAGDKVKRSVCLIKEGLCFQSFKRHDLKAFSTGHAEFGFEEVNGRRFRRDVEFFIWFEFVLTTVEHFTGESFLLLALRHCIVWFIYFDRS